MGDPRAETDLLIDALCQFSQLVSFRERLLEAARTDSRTCGHCEYWMKSRLCPREKHDSRTGRSTGPSMNATACEKFALKAWVAKLKQERLDSLEADMRAAGLPVPERAKAQGGG